MSVMEECTPKATTSQKQNLPVNRWIKAKIRKRNSAYRKLEQLAALPCGQVCIFEEGSCTPVEKNHLKRMSKLGSKQFWKTLKYNKENI